MAAPKIEINSDDEPNASLDRALDEIRTDIQLEPVPASLIDLAKGLEDALVRTAVKKNPKLM